MRIHLPKEEKKHISPKSKKQLTESEINFITYWIELGVPKKTLGQLGVKRNKIGTFISKKDENFYPNVEFNSPNTETIKNLLSKNILISPINRESNLLNISTLNYPKFGNQQMELLGRIQRHLVSIDLIYSSVNDSIFNRLTHFPNLVKIKLNYTQTLVKE